MQNFNNSVAELRALIEAIGESYKSHPLFDDITVPEPSLPKDELFFTRLVAWGYVLLNEAFPVCLKQIIGVMRQSNPEMHKHYQHTRDIIDSLRTFQSHNLPSTSKRNEDRIRDIDIWKINNGGSPFSWEVSCDSLCQSINKVICDLRSVWNSISSDQDDKEVFLESLSLAFNNDWPAYLFDELVERSALSIGLKDFDATGFRKHKGNVDNWRKISALFSDRESAKEAVERAIKRGLISIFGSDD